MDPQSSRLSMEGLVGRTVDSDGNPVKQPPADFVPEVQQPFQPPPGSYSPQEGQASTYGAPEANGPAFDLHPDPKGAPGTVRPQHAPPPSTLPPPPGVMPTGAMPPPSGQPLGAPTPPQGPPPGAMPPPSGQPLGPPPAGAQPEWAQAAVAPPQAPPQMPAPQAPPQAPPQQMPAPQTPPQMPAPQAPPSGFVPPPAPAAMPPSAPPPGQALQQPAAAPQAPAGQPPQGAAPQPDFAEFDPMVGSFADPEPGWPVQTAQHVAPEEPLLEVQPEASHLLPPDSDILPIRFTPDGRLVVVMNREPSPVDVRKVEQLSGRPVQIKVVSPQTHDLYRAKLAQMPSAAPTIERILQAAVDEGASDIHVGVGNPPVIRVGGKVGPMNGWGPLSASDLDEAFMFLHPDTAQNESWEGDHDLAITFAERRMRVSLYRQRGTRAASLRVLPSKIPPLESLGLPESIGRLVQMQDGLILLVGATGSGKSTTLAAVLDRVNRSRQGKLITIEDPIEYIHASRRCLVHQREVGDDTKSFQTALRGALRQNPDFILVGEMRDPPTMKIALEAAETGHLVFSTLHAHSAPSAVDRIIDFFPADEQEQIRTMLAGVLRAVIRQVLLPDAHDPRKRHAACEVMMVNDAIANNIREGDTEKILTSMQAGASLGMVSMDQSLARLVAADKISPEEAMLHANNVEYLQEQIAARWS